MFLAEDRNTKTQEDELETRANSSKIAPKPEANWATTGIRDSALTK